MDIQTLLIYLFFAALLGVITGAVAQHKGESFFGWWLFGTLLFIIALPMVLIMPRNERELAKRKNCPYCGKVVKLSDVSCPGCRRTLPRIDSQSWERTVAGGDEVSKWASKNDSEAS